MCVFSGDAVSSGDQDSVKSGSGGWRKLGHVPNHSTLWSPCSRVHVEVETLMHYSANLLCLYTFSGGKVTAHAQYAHAMSGDFACAGNQCEKGYVSAVDL